MWPGHADQEADKEKLPDPDRSGIRDVKICPVCKVSPGELMPTETVLIWLLVTSCHHNFARTSPFSGNSYVPNPDTLIQHSGSLRWPRAKGETLDNRKGRHLWGAFPTPLYPLAKCNARRKHLDEDEHGEVKRIFDMAQFS